ncbi:hypothetical protein HUS23_08105 [Ectothiorhodospiraceae bacterium 2226]|nr:hypothetical protein HUS23_08105 [Ectothiorhodospiraceae bacterium 2226]
MMGVLLTLPLAASDVRYSYDELGRLIEAFDTATGLTRYTYDPAGNLIGVNRYQGAAPPNVDDQEVAHLRCGASVEMSISGSGFDGVRLEASDPDILIDEVRLVEGVLMFTLTPLCSAPHGDHRITIIGIAGSTEVPLSLGPKLPTLSVHPTPLAVPPDGSTRQFYIRLSSPDTIQHAIALATDAPDVAAAGEGELVIPPGETEVVGALRGLSAGFTTLRVSADALKDIAVPVFVTAEFAGINTSYTPVIGVVIPIAEQAPDEADVAIPASAIGVVLGAAVTGVDPSTVALGSEQVPVHVRGVGLYEVAHVTIVPHDGLVWSAPAPLPDGAGISFLLDVDEAAPTTLRRIVLHTDEGAAIPAQPGADRLRVTLRAPVLHSVSPINLVPGTSGMEVVLRGANFHDALSVDVVPPEGIAVGESPVISADGTMATTTLSVSPTASYGERVVRIVTPGGSTSVTPTPFNTVRIVPDIDADIPNLLAAQVGVRREVEIADAERASAAQTVPVGVTRGAVLAATEPSALMVGETRLLTVSGRGLQNVDQLAFMPDEGIALDSAVLASGDGTAVSVQVTVAPDAVTTRRQIVLHSAGQRVPPVRADADRIWIASGAPQVQSVSPLVFVAGEVVPITLRGVHLEDAFEVEFVPQNGISIGELVPGGNGTWLSTVVSVAQDASLGERTIRVRTPAGATSPLPGPSNRVYITESPGTDVSALAGPSVGVLREQVPQDSPPESRSTHAVTVGVLKEEAVDPSEIPRLVSAARAGVAKGPVALGLSPVAGLPGQQVDLHITGHGLTEPMDVRFEPGTGIVVEESQAHDAGGILIRVTLEADAPPVVHSLTIEGEQGAVHHAKPAQMLFEVGYGSPAIHSIEPILGGRGDLVDLLIRGESLNGAWRVYAEPGEGVVFDSHTTVNAAGTEVRVPVQIEATAPLGPRVIRVVVPGAVSEGPAEPANTFTIYEAVP